MLISMTGYGNGSASAGSIVASVEVRSVNNRYFEVGMRLPKSLQNRELEIKEFLKTRVNRGKLSLAITIQSQEETSVPLRVNREVVKGYRALLDEVRDLAASTIPCGSVICCSFQICLK